MSDAGRLGRGIYYSYSYGDKRRVTKRLLHPLDIYGTKHLGARLKAEPTKHHL